MYEQIAILYEQLQQFKHSTNFHKYGFAQAGKNANWIKRVQTLYLNNIKTATAQELTCCASLESLAFAYCNSKYKYKIFKPAHVATLEQYIFITLEHNNALMPSMVKTTIWKQIKKVWERTK